MWGDSVEGRPGAERGSRTSPDHYLVHTVRARPGGLLHDLYGPSFSVNSAHHQAVGQLGEGLRVTAWSAEGFPEAIAWDERHIMAFQFHPERMSFANRRPDTIDAGALFRIFLEVCRQNRPEA